MPQTLPLEIDFYALWIFLGIVQALFLSYFFIFNAPKNVLSNRFLGAALIASSLCLLEILLCYTNYMFRVIELVDFSEPCNFLFAPLIYLHHRTLFSIPSKKPYWLHFLPFLIYFTYFLFTFYGISDAAKYNAYINAYHPSTLPFLPIPGHFSPWIYVLRDWVDELMLLQLCIYTFLGYKNLRTETQNQKIDFWSNQHLPVRWYRISLYYSVLTICVVLVAKLSHRNDLGDHFIATFITLMIYILSFIVMSQSALFHQKTVKKYEKSSLTDDIQAHTLEKLIVLMKTEKPFLNPSFSLPWLAQKLAVSPHHLSQILNESLGQSFFDFTAQYRIEEAQVLLKNEATAHIKIEEIAEMVGYNSKSAFNTAFKKLTGQTPSVFRMGK